MEKSSAGTGEEKEKQKMVHRTINNYSKNVKNDSTLQNQSSEVSSPTKKR